MLHPKQNRIDYGDQLIPPAGYTLQRAIGTTYSLDLEALMVLPVALFYSQPLDGDPAELRYDMLDAITKAAEKITIYCQKAQIKVPHKYHALLAYWENGIEEVQMAHYDQSFHPKVWIIKYIHPEFPPVYRLLVTSRNLTFARDWDVAFSTDGAVGEEDVKLNMPLIDFLKELDKHGKTPIEEDFYSDLQKVKFDKDLGKFNRLRLHPIGVKDLLGKQFLNPVSTAKGWEDLLIVSPFVDNTTLKTLSKICGTKPYLLSRKEEMDSIDLELLLKFKCFQFSKLIEYSELNEELNESDGSDSIQNLHAKLFVTQQENKISWFLGSANCTDPAQGRNIEFMVELRGDSLPGIRPKDIFNQLTNPEKADGVTLFEPYDSENRNDITEWKKNEIELRKIRHALALLTIKGKAIQIEGGTAYDLVIEIDASLLEMPAGFNVKIKPISEENKKPAFLIGGQINLIKQFTGYAETRLSPFLEFEICCNDSKCSFLLMMEIELPTGRFNKIFSSIIDSSDKFLKYLSFLITGEETAVIETGTNKPGVTNGGYTHSLFDQLPIYEKLLIASSRYPEKLAAVDKLMQRLKDESPKNHESIISEEFEEFWQIFRLYNQSLQHAK